MLLIKRICKQQRRPVFEVMGWPASELEHWSIFFSIDDNNDSPIIEVTMEESKNKFRQLMS